MSFGNPPIKYYGVMDTGLLALDTITLESSSGGVIPLQYMIFGCGHNNLGNFYNQVMGIVGLGRGPLSLISQIGSSFGGRRFSHCLVPYYSDYFLPSIMTFGSGSEVMGDGVVSTPLITKEFRSHYYVTLKGISVGDTYLSLHRFSKGNMIIDSGTTLTLLPQKLHDQVVDEVKKQVPLKPIIDDPQFGGRLCYRTLDLQEPIITTHFEGANIQLKPIQTFYQPKFDVFCFAFGSISDSVGIYGNLAQTNYLIGFDLEKEVVSFKATQCNLHHSLV
ncbi:PREDICTED: aspartic proteinase CDR1-like [Lupinus angustifolius]|uniref:aspartic proteinase CDR1-like n=1 Tax=Lupinus angustifolius TaxID=3871 RepID=UPI00092FD670|nr:PREDICTED: aspartic proteinase CDR1-like [Lupinus angustifolius]